MFTRIASLRGGRVCATCAAMLGIGVLAVALLAGTAAAQTFSSGSTGADGALVVNQNTQLQVPSSGVFNFTTVTVNAPLSFTPNQRNTPVLILAVGNVVINAGGRIIVDANGNSQTPGPGGFYGGNQSQQGFGPGGGAGSVGYSAAGDGRWVGPLSLVPPVGGSGGGGSYWSGGGGGGGAVVIASSTSIQCLGGIYARGSDVSSYAGDGAGGAIRLVANSVTGTCELRAAAGGGSSNHGIVRVEAQAGQLLYTGATTPPAVLSTINPEVLSSSTTASLSIASIAGFPVLSDAGVRPGTVDVVLPRATADPLSVVVQGKNIPVGTQVNLTLSGSSGTTYTPATLAGAYELSTGTLLVSGLNRDAETHLFVFATFDVPLGAANLNPAGPDQVAKLRVQTSPGKPSTMTFLRGDGSEIDPDKIPSGLLDYLDYQRR